ncbi:MAG: stage III sporulation protein AF [Clostridia bacterium]|nr:stage III sporulation protein AF [Clostridia bacterium]
MSELGVYLLSVVGVVFLLVIIELVLPDSKISKYIRSIFAIFIVVVIIAPVAKLIKNDWDFNSIIMDFNYELNQNYLDSVNAQNISLLERELEAVINKEYKGAKVSISANFSGGEEKISYIFVDLSDLVINENNEHINYYTAIKELVRKQIDIDDERVVVYG